MAYRGNGLQASDWRLAVHREQGYDAQARLSENESVAKTQETVDNDSRDSKQSGGETNGRDDARGNAGTDESVHEETEQPTNARRGKMGNRTTGGNRVGSVRQDARSTGESSASTGEKAATVKGQEHVAYINSLTYAVKVGGPRRVKLEAEGKDTGLGGIVADERVAAQNQIKLHGDLLVAWAKKHGISKKHITPERKKHQQQLIDDYYNQGVYAKGKQAFLILGLPAAGKSSLDDSFRNHRRYQTQSRKAAVVVDTASTVEFDSTS